VATLSKLAAEIGQKGLVQTVENPGYVFNWLLRSLLQSALQLKAKGVAQPDEIDFAWRQVTGMELGPFGIMDQIGLDLIHQTMSAARFVDGDAHWQPLIDQLQPFIDSHRLGLKTGEGFFKYDGPQRGASGRPENQEPPHC
jgi:3-hydroxybutyryl-CoA dehydrogenase